MNRTLTDPHLRTFRQPLTHRLRLRIDELRDELAASNRLVSDGAKRIAALEKDLRKAERDKASLLVRCHRAERLVMGGGDALDLAPELDPLG